MSPEVYTVAPIAKHMHTIIFLHGRDSTAKEFASEFFESQASDNHTFGEIFPHLKLVCPCSNVRISKRFDSDMCQRFDIWSVENPEERPYLQTPGLTESAATIRDIIHHEALEVPRDRIILAGISQGCATAIYTLLCGNLKLGGFIGLCGWLPHGIEIVKHTEINEDALETPVFLSHSIDDEVVPLANGELLRKGLDQLNMAVEWHCYGDGGHWVNEPKGVDDIVVFITKVIQAAANNYINPT